ncbi:DUF4430 domain-containing protein [Candidatus Falkowbacteria bacterium]|nr:DUF4430 domain-containing protein [Candidatus Falkowbacteria bacterium]
MTKKLAKKIKMILIAMLALGLLSDSALVTAGNSEAVDYLKSQTQDAWSVMALASAGEENISLSHLASVSGNAATDYAKTVLALAAVNENPAIFGNVDYISQLKSFHQSGQIGSTSLINDDIWTILALASVGQIDSVPSQDAKNFIINNQNPDGGFSYAVGGASDSNDTAAAIMALVEAGLSPSDPIITGAVNYLKTVQNADGGFGYQSGNDSDSGSDSWVISAINKLGQNPAGWDKDGNNPLGHLESLQDTDGGFWWVEPGTAEFNNKAMTAYALVALSGKSYPVGYYQQQQQAGTFHLRIEGSESTICDAYVTGPTALDLIKNGADVCGYAYNVTQESYGLYLRGINDEAAEGLAGWLYFVNSISPLVGAGDYVLAEGDEVLFYYGQWGFRPTRISADQTEIDPGQTINLTAEYFNGAQWLILPSANFKVNADNRAAGAGGQLALTIAENGIYEVYVQMPEFVRSEKIRITVGDTVSQNVSLRVEINQGGDEGSGRVGGESIALIVDASQLDFGVLKPGETSDQTVTLTNGGTVSLDIGASVSGDAVFLAGITLDDENHGAYQTSLIPVESKPVEVSLTVPNSYLASGLKSGELIFWASSQ